MDWQTKLTCQETIAMLDRPGSYNFSVLGLGYFASRVYVRSRTPLVQETLKNGWSVISISMDTHLRPPNCADLSSSSLFKLATSVYI